MNWLPEGRVARRENLASRPTGDVVQALWARLKKVRLGEHTVILASHLDALKLVIAEVVEVELEGWKVAQDVFCGHR